MIDFANIQNRQRSILVCSSVSMLLSLVILSGGCTGVPVANQSTAPIAGVPVARSASAAQNTSLSKSTRVAPPAMSAIQRNSSANRDIAQVGFGSSVHVGDDNCPGGCAGGDCGCAFGPCANSGAGCGNTAPFGYAMPMVPQPWLYDPQEFLCDGGDQPPHAVLTRDDRIRGLQPEDTVTHYTTEAGDVEFAASNKVCVYAPRFGNVRRITGAIQGDGAIGVAGASRPVGPQDINYDLPGLVMKDAVALGQQDLTRRIDSMRERNRGVRIEGIQQPLQAADVRTVLAGIQNVGLSELDEAQLALLERYAVAATIWTLDESVEVAIQDLAPPVLTRDQKIDALVVYDFPGPGRLNLIKLADKNHAAIGDTVTFALRLQNVGDSAVSGVVVTDNLVTRLEYVADSQSASVDADFQTQSNEADSSQLIWRLKKKLAVGESVTFEFKCLVR